jgi:hypothetical protein
MEIIGRDIERIACWKGKGPLPVDRASALSSYVRVLSAVRRDRSPARGGAGKLAGKSVGELLEMCRADPELAEALGLLGGHGGGH